MFGCSLIPRLALVSYTWETLSCFIGFEFQGFNHLLSSDMIGLLPLHFLIGFYRVLFVLPIACISVFATNIFSTKG